MSWLAIYCLIGFFHLDYVKMSDPQVYTIDFEVFGRVQGVFFRKYTEKQAKSLNLNGWCMNTRDDTVKGQLEGPLREINEMKYWLEKTGSPQSRIDKTVFSEIKTVETPKFTKFAIVR